MKRRKQKSIISGHTLAIDGHNVCYQCPVIADIMHHDMEAGRRLFEQRIGTHRHWHIFYDGGPGGIQRRQSSENLSLHYSGGNTSADDILIEWLCYQTHPITVVTNDRHLQARARTHSAHIISVHDFLSHIDRPQATAQPGTEAPSQTEIDFWRRQFGV